MAMARRKKPITPYERKRWLEQLENGKGITKIAKDAGHDIRVVQRHIEIALQEREAARARHDFLLSRIEEHQSDLLSEVRRLQKTVLRLPPQPLEPHESTKKKIHQALVEHIKRTSLRRLLDAYLNAVQEYEQARSHTATEISGIEAKIVSKLPSEVNLYSWATRLVEPAGKEEQAPEHSDRSYQENLGDDGQYKPSWGEFSLTRSSVNEDQLTRVLKAHRELISESASCLLPLRDQRRRLRELGSQVAEELEVLLLKRVITGRCRYCPI
jgi:hypothetical protein